VIFIRRVKRTPVQLYGQRKRSADIQIKVEQSTENQHIPAG